jgi:Rod binding domain-containing protein
VSAGGIEGLSAAADGAGAAQRRRLDAAKSAASSGDVERAAEQFQSLLGAQLFREMRRGVEGGFFGEGSGAGVYEGWLDERIGEALAKRDALGLAQAIRASLGRKQAESSQEGDGR